MSTIFLTSSGTNIGKTYVTSLLTRQFREKGIQAQAVKPIMSGFDEAAPADSDTVALLTAMNKRATPENIAYISPWRFRAALSPDMAAAREDREVDFAALVQHGLDMSARHDPLIIEGVGGVMVPLNREHTVLDWMLALKRLELIPLLVVGSYLGTISHTLTALAQMRANNLPPRAIIVSETEGSTVPLQETIETITRFASPTRVTGLARNAEPGLLGLLD
jgi:dethiobiotin synthetase